MYPHGISSGCRHRKANGDRLEGNSVAIGSTQYHLLRNDHLYYCTCAVHARVGDISCVGIWGCAEPWTVVC